MAKWDYLLEADRRLRDLERAISQGGSLEDWAAYRRHVIRTTNTDPVRDAMRRILGDGSAQAELKTQLGLPQKFPADLEGEFTVEDEGRRYRIVVNQSASVGQAPGGFGSAGGVGSRIKIECPMCRKMIGASMSAFGMGGHLKRKDHGNYVKRKTTINRLTKGIFALMKKRGKDPRLGILTTSAGGSGFHIIAPPGKRDAIVAFMFKHYGDKGLRLVRTKKLAAHVITHYQGRGINVDNNTVEFEFRVV